MGGLGGGGCILGTSRLPQVKCGLVHGPIGPTIAQQCLSKGLSTPGNTLESKLLAQFMADLGCVKCQVDQGTKMASCLRILRAVAPGLCHTIATKDFPSSTPRYRSLRIWSGLSVVAISEMPFFFRRSLDALFLRFQIRLYFHEVVHQTLADGASGAVRI